MLDVSISVVTKAWTREFPVVQLVGAIPCVDQVLQQSVGDLGVGVGEEISVVGGSLEAGGILESTDRTESWMLLCNVECVCKHLLTLSVASE